MNRKVFLFLLLDIFFVLSAFWLSVWLKDSSFSSYFYNYYKALILFGVIWILLSLLFKKFYLYENLIINKTKQIILCNLTILAISTFLIYLLRSDRYSRFLVIGTIGFTTIIELVFFYFWVILKKTKILSEDFLTPPVKNPKIKDENKSFRVYEPIEIDRKRERIIKNELLQELGNSTYSYLTKSVKLFYESTLIISTSTRFNVISQRDNHYDTIINLKRVNDIRYINKFFEAVNSKLPKGGLFVCLAETKDLRKKRILSKFPPILNYLYYSLDFLLKRVFPKFPISKNIYFFLTRGENRVISYPELLGRLYSCGFVFAEDELIDNLLYIVVRKIKQPLLDIHPTYGLFIKLKRVGKDGKFIEIYKLRTMHPYSEFIQDYVYNKNGMLNGDKALNDFRVTNWGRFLRRFWIDEIPMLYNLINGDVKLVGVRPLSFSKFNMYPEWLQKKRTKFKPGLLPPFYSDKVNSFQELMDSENEYLDQYSSSPIYTDIKYFFKIIYSILFKRTRAF